jgi:hypothetical protein
VLVDATGRFPKLVEWAFVAEAMGGGSIAYMLTQAETLVFALIGEGCQLSIKALRTSPFLCQCTLLPFLGPLGRYLPFL